MVVRLFYGSVQPSRKEGRFADGVSSGLTGEGGFVSSPPPETSAVVGIDTD